MSYKSKPFNVHAQVCKPTRVNTRGKLSYKYDWKKNSSFIFCSLSKYGGTKINNDDVLVVKDTALIECWATDKVKTFSVETRIRTKGFMEEEWQIISPVEIIDERSQIAKFRVQKVETK